MGDDKALDFFAEAFICELREEFLHKVVTVEFFCGQCCKKAKKGVLVKVGKDFIVLVRRDGRAIKVITFGEKGPIDKERVEKIIIPIKQVCSVEIPDPCEDEDIKEAKEESS